MTKKGKEVKDDRRVVIIVSIAVVAIVVAVFVLLVWTLLPGLQIGIGRGPH